MLSDREREIYSRTELLTGSAGLAALSGARVIVFGVGGVGGWCAEALLRTGVKHLTIVDFDNVSISNINRQVMATAESVGRPKAEVFRERLLQIDPDAAVKAVLTPFNADTAEGFDLTRYDCVVDAIDSVKDKAELIIRVTEAGIPLFSSMGAALKMDAGSVKTAEFRKVAGCRLALALRHRFKKEQRFPAGRFMCVYSEERLENSFPSDVNGSMMHITATFGMRLAGMVISHILSHAEQTPAQSVPAAEQP